MSSWLFGSYLSFEDDSQTIIRNETADSSGLKKCIKKQKPEPCICESYNEHSGDAQLKALQHLSEHADKLTLAGGTEVGSSSWQNKLTLAAWALAISQPYTMSK